MDQTFALFLLVGMVVMSVPMMLMALRYGIAWWKSVISTVLLTVVGFSATLLMFYIEHGEWGGASFFGAVFFVPLVFIVIALVLRIPYFKLLDLCGVGECVTMAMLRFNCSIQGCCGGRVIYTAADGAVVRFPSQMVELIVGLSLAVLFVYCAYRKPRLHGIMYPWFMFLYGMIRTGLNFFREEWASWPETQVFPRGMIWSVASLFIGLVWLWIAYRYRKKAIQEMSE